MYLNMFQLRQSASQAVGPRLGQQSSAPAMSTSWPSLAHLSEGKPDSPSAEGKPDSPTAADELYELRQKCPSVSLQPSPSEAGDIHEAMALGADSGSTDIDKYMLARHVQAIRRRAAAVEKSVYFMEKRQDAAASLPSETARHQGHAFIHYTAGEPSPRDQLEWSSV